jgi:hypothetical protein
MHYRLLQGPSWGCAASNWQRRENLTGKEQSKESLVHIITFQSKLSCPENWRILSLEAVNKSRTRRVREPRAAVMCLPNRGSEALLPSDNAPLLDFLNEKLFAAKSNGRA